MSETCVTEPLAHSVCSLRSQTGRNTVCAAPWWCSCSRFSDSRVFLQVSEAILDNARLMLQTENIQANAEDFKDRSEVTHTTLCLNLQLCG